MKDSSKDVGAAEADKRAVGLMMTSAAAAIKDGVVAEAGERAVGSMVTTESQGGVRAAKDGGSRGGYSSEDSAASAAATASRPHGMRSAAAMAKAAAEEDYGNHASAAMRPQYIFWQQHHLWYDRMRQRSNESLTEYKRRWDEETERYVAAGGSLRSDQIQALMFLQSLEEKPAVVQFKVDLSNNVMEGTGTYPASVSAMYNTLYQRKVVVQTASKPGTPGTVASSEFSFITTTVGRSSHAPKSTGGGGGKATSSQIKKRRT
jgi:hypothetical protein